MKEILEANSNITANSKQLEVLKKNFPQCFDKNGNFIIHKMQEIVGEHGLDLSKESYSLNWLGKSYARLLANENPLTLLKEDKQHNKKPNNINSENLLIKGDNLEVLKHLSSAYSEQIKMIYIDPPYNTGSDGFVYNDDRTFSTSQLCQLAGIDHDEAKRILEFTASKANSHSAWLTFMYPRLYIARELLSDDGVIFISIDDNEVAQLKMLCDEIFGEENFVAKYIHKNNSSKNQAKLTSVSTEYFYCYSKNYTYLKSNYIWRLKKKGVADIAKQFKRLKTSGLSLNEINEDIKEMYKRPKYAHLSRWNKVDDNGVFKDADLSREGGPKNYSIKNPNTGNYCTIPSRGWGKSKIELERLQSENLIWYGDNDTPPGVKDYINSDDVSVPDNFWYFDNSIDTRWIKSQFGSLVFENPKPLEMIKQILEMSCQINDSKILDFFAGSGTTAHAVMQLNADDGGNRKHISVQLPEKTDKKSKAFDEKYYTIFDITKARIEKSAIKIAEENLDYQGDLGFKIFETTPVFDGYLDEINEFDPQIELFDGKKLTDEELEILLCTWKVYDGLHLTDNLQTLDLNGYKGYYSDTTVYLMDKGFGINCIKALITKLDGDETFAPAKVVLFGYNFDSVEQKQLVEGLNNYRNKKSIELDVLVRY